MLDRLAEFADKYDMFPEEGLILAAVSGGADSMCLLAALLELAEKRGFSVAAAHFNHQLRGEESERDASFVARFCHDRDIALYSGSGDVGAFSRSQKIGTEESARRLRYGFLIETAKKIDAKRIATAHTADDNAETVLLNLTRGAGLDGLCGIPPTRDNIIRPMLTVTRDDVLEFLALRNIPYVEDSTNGLDIYNRNLIRHRVVPVLKDINAQFYGHISVTTSLIREDALYLNDMARQYVREHCVRPASSAFTTDARALVALPRPVSSRVIRLIYGNNLTAGHISAVLALCMSDDVSGELALPQGAAFREYDTIVFTHGTAAAGFAPVRIEAGVRAALPELGLTVTCRTAAAAMADCGAGEKIHKTFTTFLFKNDNICGKIVIRPRETGDKINLFGRNGTKTLKKLFIEQRIPRRLRSLIPVISDEKGVLAVYGIGIDKRAAYHAGDQTLEIIFEETAYEK